jgi:hypothetical protein
MGFRRGPKTAKSVALYVVGIALFVAALIIVLNGLGVLAAIPSYVIWAVILLGLGFSVIAGVSNASS